jgi:hypothetical protein
MDQLRVLAVGLFLILLSLRPPGIFADTPDGRRRARIFQITVRVLGILSLAQVLVVLAVRAFAS